MPQINHDIFLAWAENHFDIIKEKGSQLKVNSIFCDDSKFKLYINTELNAYNCYKSSKSGNLYKLVSIVENCTYQEAVEILGGQHEIHRLDEIVKEFYKNKKAKKVEQDNDIALPNNTFKISELNLDNPFRIKAEKYLASRKINFDLMVCTSGITGNRIVIPYYDKDGKLIYYNARTLGDSSSKYMFPTNAGIGKGDILYFPEYKDEDTVFATEGELNAITLYQCGYHTCSTGGKQISDKQIQLLKNYNVVLALDLDRSGIQATCKTAKKLMADNGFRYVHYVLPPDGINDWNDMLVKYDVETVKDYILKNEQLFDEIKYKTIHYKEF